MMSTDNRFIDTVDPEATVGDLLSYAALLNTPQLARLYMYVLQHGPVTIEAVKDDLDIPHSTTYKYVGDLEEMDVLTRHEGERPTEISVEPVHITLENRQGEVVATPVLVAAVGRQLESEDIRVFVERQGVPKLAAALHYTFGVRAGDLTQRTAANKLGVHPVEGMTVITALQDVVDEAPAFDPYLESTE